MIALVAAFVLQLVQKKIITIHLNHDGFYEPYIAESDKCISCRICLEVCAFNHEKLALNFGEKRLKSWAAWSNDESTRRCCSSGGIGFEIGKQLIKKGFQTVACKYNVEEHRAEHFVASTVDEFVQSIGSKYIQSYTERAFKQIKCNGQKYFLSGTPCQIDSFRRFVRKFHCEDNFVLMDFYCHGVPSMLAWKSYIKMLEPKLGKIIHVSWRNKIEYGCFDSAHVECNEAKLVDWHDCYNMLVNGKDAFFQSRESQGDLFFRFFLGNLCLGTQCEKKCKYKYDQSSADIRVGDFWGGTYADDKKGVSALIAFTEKGRLVIEGLENVTLIEHPFEIVTEGQMKENAKAKITKPIVMAYLRKGKKIDGLTFKMVLFVQKVLNKLESMFKK